MAILLTFRMKACKRCGADMYWDGEEWKCLLCSRPEGYENIKVADGKVVREGFKLRGQYKRKLS